MNRALKDNLNLACRMMVVLALPSVALATQGGSGMRGGAGVVCAGWRAPVALEEYIVTRMNTPNGDLDLASLLEKIPDPFFRESVREKLVSNREPKDWLKVESFRSREDEFRRWATYRLDAESRLYLYRLFFGPTRSGPVSQDYRVYDEELDVYLGRHCEIVQLAVTGLALDHSQIGPVLLTHGESLPTNRQRQILALHEATYVVGALIGHRTALPTRNLIVSLLRHPSGHSEIQKSFDDFVGYAKDREAFINLDARLSPLRRGQMLLVRSEGKDRECAQAKAVTFVGRDTFAVREFYGDSGDDYRRFSRFPTSGLETLFRSGTCVFRTQFWE